MTEAEEMAVKAITKTIAQESVNDGIMAAVEMIRIAAQKCPEWSFDQLANCIEATVIKDNWTCFPTTSMTRKAPAPFPADQPLSQHHFSFL